jgi:hypothetical protein
VHHQLAELARGVLAKSRDKVITAAYFYELQRSLGESSLLFLLPLLLLLLCFQPERRFWSNVRRRHYCRRTKSTKSRTGSGCGEASRSNGHPLEKPQAFPSLFVIAAKLRELVLVAWMRGLTAVAVRFTPPPPSQADRHYRIPFSR